MGSRGCPTMRKIRRILIVIGDGGRRAYKWFCVFENFKPTFFLCFFSNVFSYQGEHLKNFFWYQKVNFRASRSKMDPKIDTFGQFDTCDLAISGVKKIVFWTFSKLFWTCLGSDWALFSALKGLLLGVF